MRFFGIDPEQQEKTTVDDRLQRPWTVAIFGVLLSLGVVVLKFAKRSAGDEKAMLGIVLFACVAAVLSVVYAWLGWRYSRTLARRVVGWIGGTLALVGVGVLVWVLRRSLNY